MAELFFKQLNDGDADNALETAEEIIEKDRDNEKGEKYYGLGLKGQALFTKAVKIGAKSDELDDEPQKEKMVEERLQLEEEAHKCMDLAIENLKEDDKNFTSELYMWKAYHTSSAEEGRRFCIAAMDSEEQYVDALERYNDMTSVYIEDLNAHLNTDDDWKRIIGECDSNEEYQEFLAIVKEDANSSSFVNRTQQNKSLPLIYIVKDDKHLKGCYDSSQTISHIFTLDAIPKELKFPVGHPVANALYMPHPTNSALYIPYDGAEKQLFLDKIREFCYLVQCLGATNIAFKSLKGQRVTSDINLSDDLSFSGDFKIHTGTGNLNREKASSKNIESNSEVDLVQTFSPTKTPYIPEDVVWFPTEASWQQLAKQRLAGNLLHYEICLTSRDSSNITNSQKTAINAAYKNLVLTINVNYNSQFNENISNFEESEMKIIVDFKHLDEFDVFEKQSVYHETHNKGEQVSELSEAEQKYKEEILFYLEDGEIGNSERRILERKRIKLGISEEKAKSIETSCSMPSLPEEIEYLGIVKELLSDGEMTERKRKILNREAEFWGITTEQKLKIEQLANNE